MKKTKQQIIDEQQVTMSKLADEKIKLEGTIASIKKALVGDTYGEVNLVQEIQYLKGRISVFNTFENSLQQNHEEVVQGLEFENERLWYLIRVAFGDPNLKHRSLMDVIGTPIKRDPFPKNNPFDNYGRNNRDNNQNK